MTTISAVQHEMSARMSRRLTEQLRLEAGLKNDLRTAWIYPQPITKKRLPFTNQRCQREPAWPHPCGHVLVKKHIFWVIEKAVCFCVLVGTLYVLQQPRPLSGSTSPQSSPDKSLCQRVARLASHHQFVRYGMELDKPHHQEGN